MSYAILALDMAVVLDLPVPPSVNRARRVNWGKDGYPKLKAWHQQADNLLMIASRYKPARIERFELQITVSDQHTGMDLDNGLKALIDYLRRIEAIANDAPANMRRLTVEWGEAPQGCRVQIRPWGG
jgi:Holliday junction resolvase RusA-like endonuclease